MKTRITIHRFGGASNDRQFTRYRIEIKKHWWSKWRIRDYEDKEKMRPLYYKTYLEAVNNL